jgi:hypothetical protein
VTDTKIATGLTAIMRPLPARKAAGWSKATLASLSEVEDLLDQLENAGYKQMRVTLVGEKFVIRWR